MQRGAFCKGFRRLGLRHPNWRGIIGILTSRRAGISMMLGSRHILWYDSSWMCCRPPNMVEAFYESRNTARLRYGAAQMEVPVTCSLIECRRIGVYCVNFNSKVLIEILVVRSGKRLLHWVYLLVANVAYNLICGQQNKPERPRCIKATFLGKSTL